MENKIETIFEHGDGTLGVDGKGNLYWNGKRVITEQQVSLRWWVNLSVIIASISTLIIAIVSVCQHFNPTCG